MDKLTYVVARPILVLNKPYGMIIPLRRIGMDEELFDVYELRTMQPYAEFLQEYIYCENHIAAGGKFSNDFRITSWGRWMRKLCLDGQPMWINWLQGDLKFVGVCPIYR